MKKPLFLVLCLFIGCSLWSYYSDQFVVGCYSDLKPNSWSTSLNNNLLTKMQAAHYNASICENTENSPNLPLMSSLLTAFHDHSIDPLLVDYHNGYDPTTGGTHRSALMIFVCPVFRAVQRPPLRNAGILLPSQIFLLKSSFPIFPS